MRTSKFTPEQMVHILRVGDSGMPVVERLTGSAALISMSPIPFFRFPLRLRVLRFPLLLLTPRLRMLLLRLLLSLRLLRMGLPLLLWLLLSLGLLRMGLL